MSGTENRSGTAKLNAGSFEEFARRFCPELEKDQLRRDTRGFTADAQIRKTLMDLFHAGVVVKREASLRPARQDLFRQRFVCTGDFRAADNQSDAILGG